MSSSPIVLQPTLTLPEPIIAADTPDFRDKFNHSPFMFSHNLVGHPLFEIPRLVELANTLFPKGQIFSFGSGNSPGLKWGQIPNRKPIVEVLSHIGESDSCVMFKSAHIDPEYKALLDKTLIELEDITSVPLHREMTWSIATIIVSSPHVITPYHIDHDCNFLFQIHGEKDVHLFDQNDRSVLTEEEIERFYLGHISSANYREENQNKASVNHLVPGKGIHHPVLAPHWVRNKDSYSVSLSINFCLRTCDLQARIYQVNHYLRQLGMLPTPPGKSALRDKTKIIAVEMFSKRKPENHDEVVRSGIKRITAPVKLLQQVVRSLKR
ncbi:MAG: cupin-like domain-containing protein [Nostoc sp.]|uniref:cupin-like domain-containing protein n=1 Tax=Nostoc sp. TaxID=1180 RepID=UPI002FF04BFF